MIRSIGDLVDYDFYTPNDPEVWEYLETNFKIVYEEDGDDYASMSYITTSDSTDYIDYRTLVYPTDMEADVFIPTEEFKELIGMTNTKKEFTKSDLKDGMIVEYVRGDLRMVLGDNLLGIDSYHHFGGYSEDLRVGDGLDIVKVYKINGMRPLNELLTHNVYLELIWERTTKSPQQLEKEAIEQEMLALKERLSKLEV